MEPTAGTYLKTNYESLLPKLNGAWQSIKELSLSAPFTYDHAKDQLVGKIKVDGREIPVYYFGNNINQLQDLEESVNKDIAVIIFNHLVDRGEIRSKHLFKAWTGLKDEFLAVISKDGNFREYLVVPITGAIDSNRDIYDSMAGKLNLKKIEDAIDAFFAGGQKAAVDPETRAEIDSQKAYLPVQRLASDTLAERTYLEVPVVWLS